jgi:hypothetical protein
MKQLIIICSILVFTNLSAHCQEIDFAPVGAKWWINQIITDQFGIPADSFLVAEVSGEEMKEGRLCRVISNLTGHGLPPTAHVYTENDSVFFYSEVTMQFELLYDFSAEVGSSWTIYGLLDMVRDVEITVTGVSTEEIGGEQLRVWHIESNFNAEWWSDRIIERIGSPHFFTPVTATHGSSSSGILAAAGVRCYEDSSIFVKLWFQDCEWYHDISSVEEYPLDIVFRVYPNPANDVLNIFLESDGTFSSSGLKFEIIDYVNGSAVYRQAIDTNSSISIDILSWKSGMYVVFVTNEITGKVLAFRKFIKG